MKTKKIFSVSVGIPAYNEEKNIINLLKSILAQKQISFQLKKIYVVSDGSTDKTELIVKKFTENHSSIEVVADGKRLGKNKRLSQIYKLNSSDILIQMDGDVILADKLSFENLVNAFKEKNVVVACGDKIPVGGSSLMAKLLLNWNLIWRKIRNSPENINSIYNCFSCLTAFEKNFAKSIKLHPNITSESHLVYCEIMKRGLKFRFVPKAVVYFRFPPNVNDFLRLSNRSYDELGIIIKLYGEKIRKYYQTPIKPKIRVIFKEFMKRPVFTVMTIVLINILAHLPYNSAGLKKKGFWKTIDSTKTAIDVKNLKQINN